MNNVRGVHIDVMIMHHWSRAESARAVKALVEEGRWQARLVTDGLREPPSLDGLNRTFAAVLASLAPSDYTLVLQDDVAVCRDFLPTVQRMLLALPEGAPVALYCPKRDVQDALDAGHHWTRCVNGIWGQAMLLPTQTWRRFAAWNAETFLSLGAELKGPTVGDDERVAGFMVKEKTPVWVACPSVVEHLCPSQSLIGFSNSKRVAKRFIGTNVSGLTVDWRVKDGTPKSSGSMPYSTYEGWLRRYAGSIRPEKRL